NSTNASQATAAIPELAGVFSRAPVAARPGAPASAHPASPAVASRNFLRLVDIAAPPITRESALEQVECRSTLVLSTSSAMNGKASIEWEDLRYFLAVVRGGSLSAAARELGVSQPTVGRRVGAFQARLGAQLVRRTPVG